MREILTSVMRKWENPFTFRRTDTGRRDRVRTQYDSADAASNYARTHVQSSADSRYLRTRIGLVHEMLADRPSGRLLDAGCGPGALIRTLLESPKFNFRISALDQSPAMIRHCVDNNCPPGKVHATVGDLEHLPHRDGEFDVTLVTGALEYTDIRTSISEIARVTAPDGLVIVSMLNPVSPYRLFQWCVYSPAVRLLGRVERSLHVPARRRHDVAHTGISALPSSRLRARMREATLIPRKVVYFDPTLLVPPFDRFPALRRRAIRMAPSGRRARGWPHWLCTGYLVLAQRS
jgi:SAM-dependent methyltransferase